jgi:glyoxylase-like metal-dependent hydrolase (beta-lactamase superfamily II)
MSLAAGTTTALISSFGFASPQIRNKFPPIVALRAPRPGPTRIHLPDEAVKLSGVQPNEITDIVISHVHWDNFGGIDLFPKANVWIQQDEFRYYTGAPWQPGGGSFVND